MEGPGLPDRQASRRAGLFEARRLGIVWVFHEEIIAVSSSLDNAFGTIGDSFTGSEPRFHRPSVSPNGAAVHSQWA